MREYFSLAMQSKRRHIVNNGRFTVTCECGERDKHLREHLEGDKRFGLTFVTESDEPIAIILDVDNHNQKELFNECENDLVSWFLGSDMWDIYRSKSGGIHAYMWLEGGDLEKSIQIAKRLSVYLSKKYGLHVDYYPTMGRSIFLEYFGGKPNHIEKPKFKRFSMVDVERYLLSIPSAFSETADYSRSAYDMRYLMKLLREAPWNWRKDITEHYVSHTVKKIVAEPYSISKIEAKVPEPVGFFEGFELYPSTLLVLSGQPGIGKSTMVVKSIPSNAVIYCNEYSVETARLMCERFRPSLDLSFCEVSSLNELYIALLRDVPKVFAIDSLQTMMRDYDEGNRFVEWLKAYLNETGSVCVAISHENSSSDKTGIHKIEGLLRLRQLCDVHIRLTEGGMWVTKDRFMFIRNGGLTQPHEKLILLPGGDTMMKFEDFKQSGAPNLVLMAIRKAEVVDGKFGKSLRLTVDEFTDIENKQTRQRIYFVNFSAMKGLRLFTELVTSLSVLADYGFKDLQNLDFTEASLSELITKATENYGGAYVMAWTTYDSKKKRTYIEGFIPAIKKLHGRYYPKKKTQNTQNKSDLPF